MASNRPLPSDIKVTGVDQQSLVIFLQNLTDLVNELKADHETFRSIVSDNKTAINAVITAAATDIAAVAAVTPVSSSAPAALSNSTDLTLNRS